MVLPAFYNPGGDTFHPGVEIVGPMGVDGSKDVFRKDRKIWLGWDHGIGPSLENLPALSGSRPVDGFLRKAAPGAAYGKSNRPGCEGCE
jgi:hypothetical protein